jgi:hypothetical protein
MRRDFPLIAVLFCASAAGLAYELTLLRIFSITLWYHFAFMVVSIAMLGIGASGALLFLAPAMKKPRFIPRYALLIGATMPLAYLAANHVPFDPARLSWDRLQVLYMGCYALALSVPFLCFGLMMAAAFSHFREQSGLVYAADLAGAATGPLLSFWLLSGGGAERAVLIIALLPLCAVLFLSAGKLRLPALLLIAMYSALLIQHPPWLEPRISPYKPLPLALQYPGAEHLRTYYGPFSQVDLFTSPAARFAPGLSLRFSGPLPHQTGISVDAGDLHAVTDAKDARSLAFIDHLPSTLPYALSRSVDTLLIDPRGGLSILTAIRSGSENIMITESDPLVMRIMREQGLYEHAASQISVSTGLGRAWLQGREKTFDIIDLSLMSSLPGAAFGFAEDYRFTIKAFETYLDHLKPDGILAINLFIIPPPRTELRLLAGIAEAAEKSGLRDFTAHCAILRSWDSLTIVIKKSALSPGDIEAIRAFSRRLQVDLLHYPGIRPEESNQYVKMRGNDYFEAVQSLLSTERRQKFLEAYLFDVRPVRDENPFFHYYLKLGNIREIYGIMGGKWQYFIEEGYLLPVLLVQLGLVSSLLVMAPLVKLRNTAQRTKNIGLGRAFAYFAALGCGYMFIEVSFIQRMILPLEYPPYAMSVVVVSMLAGSGLGSLLSERFDRLRQGRMLLLLAAVIPLTWFGANHVLSFIGGHPLAIKILAASLVVLPAAVLMGVPFPLGLGFLGRQAPEFIPWAWAVNGCASVLAPVLAIMIALTTGFSAVILLGAGMYVMAFYAFFSGRTGQATG